MHFLSEGDFSFPFTWLFFYLKQFFVWSYQTGAVNADGIVRMPGRLFDLLVFILFGNIAFEYFYIFSLLTIVFLSFYFFSKKFLGIKSVHINLIGSLFFTLNPVFLGNLAKIGLVLAAALLPLCLLAIRAAFIHKKFRYFLFLILLLNLSLIHPFTFTVNLVVSGCYFIFMALASMDFLRKNVAKIALMGVLALLLNTYFILPLASMHTISKNALSSDVSGTTTNYTALVDTLNTGDIFTGLSLSKNVVIDFNFYNSAYQNFYFLGVFIFYALLIGIYIVVEKRLSEEDKVRFTLLLLSVLVLLLLATVTFLHFATLIDLLINLPGGWAFRSPLKWQLYLPLPLFGILVLLLQYVKNAAHRKVLYVCLGIAFVLMNGFLFTDIYKKLIKPRSIVYLSALQQMNLDHKNILFASGSRCFDFESTHPDVMTEFNQVMISKNAQLKQADDTDFSKINLSNYDFLVDCGGELTSSTAQLYGFSPTQTFAGGGLQLYTNKYPESYIRVASTNFITEPEQLSDKYGFANQVLHDQFDVVGDGVSTTSTPLTGLQDVFENLSVSDIHNHGISKVVSPLLPGTQQLYVEQQPKQPLYYADDSSGVLFSTVPQRGYRLAPSILKLQVPEKLSLSYSDPAYHVYQNMISNPSLEQGLWSKTVGDCYNYDSNPEIGMSLDKKDKTNGKQSLELRSGNHIACTGPPEVNVTPGQQYLLSFNYESPGGDGGYSLSFNDTKQTSMDGRLISDGDNWHTFTQIITAPQGANSMHLLVNAYPDDLNEGTGIVRYDNFKLIAIPSLLGKFYLVHGPNSTIRQPAHMEYKTVNPTKTLITIRGADTPFYLNTGESYSAKWRLELNTAAAQSWSPLAQVTAVPDKDHIELNGSTNSWYVDPASLCQKASSCTRNADGSYNFKLVMEFGPQRWFYAGALISGVAFVAVVTYIIYATAKDRRKWHTYQWRKAR